MTLEEAIRILNDTPVEISSGSKTTTREYSQMLHLAENAFEKQIPKKPIYSGGHEYICPNCNRFTRKREQQHGNIIIPYCKWCGQAWDWGDTE